MVDEVTGEALPEVISDVVPETVVPETEVVDVMLDEVNLAEILDDGTSDGDNVEVLDDDEVLVLDEVDERLTLPVWEPTGEPRVDAALDLLAMLDVDDISGHAEIFSEVHDQLRATLADLHSR